MLERLSQSLELIILQTQLNYYYLVWIVAILWTVFFISRFIFPGLLILGIIPRHWYGLPGIFFSPFLHANFNHIFFNTIPLLVLSNFILINGIEFYLQVTLYIMLMSGVAIWCFAKPGIHVGASAVITGYWGYLVADFYHHTSLTTIILGVISVYYFAGIFFGIFPGKKGVSWEGHLFGLCAGLATNFIITT